MNSLDEKQQNREKMAEVRRHKKPPEVSVRLTPPSRSDFYI